MFPVKTKLIFNFSEDPLDYLKQLFPDTATKDLEQALESCGGDTNQAAEFLLQGKDTGLFYRK